MKTFGMHPKFNSYLIMIMAILFGFLSHEHAAKMFFKFLEITLSEIRVIYSAIVYAEKQISDYVT